MTRKRFGKAILFSFPEDDMSNLPCPSENGQLVKNTQPSRGTARSLFYYLSLHFHPAF